VGFNKPGKHAVMLAYYKTLIAIRKQLPALNKLNRQQLAVSFNEAQNSLLLQRWDAQQQVCCVMNFSGDQQSITLTAGQNWKLVLDSADTQWGGPGASALASSTVNARPQSIIIYANNYV
jgi:maltooligosyltrehalose trehalohydrolase